ncbi:histidine kinase [Streptomyces iconiensis]|uniref:histidine kinase n=1 Tax=Streptomyces iconiensis TaxID=1384038 RepID=A0ABT6ZSN8_9ACTN|nr:histidine kinase [Streptomyces iconiensis]MDJ1132080.1 histidine kinase [Streptomyces iconiensis]
MELWHRFDTVAWYVVALVLFTGSLLPAFQSQGTMLGGMPPRPFDALAIVAVAFQALPVAVCRRWPVACLVLVVLGFAVDQLRGYHSFAGTALPLALIAVGAKLERRRRVTALLLTAAYVALVLALSQLGPGESPGEYLMFYLAVTLAWGVGTWLRSVRAAEADRRRRVAEDSRLAERTRIAGELHDVVTHHVTAMVVQAEAARYLTAAPERLDQSLTAVGDTGRRAISDLRHLLDLLNPDYGTPGNGTGGHGIADRRTAGHRTPEHGTEARTPSVGSLLTLVEQTRRAGQQVEFTEEGTPTEPTGSADLVAYRVVQEALTNALKYARGSRTSVQVHYSEREITVEVSTDGSGARSGSPGGSGRGLAGLRERVDILGGDFSAGRRTGGGFVVRARIPAGSPA